MARSPGRAGCAAESRQRGEPLIATASRVQRWLLIEQERHWGRDALFESRFPTDIAAEIDAAARASGVRVLLIRRWRGGFDEPGPQAAFVARSGRAHRWLEQVDFDDPTELLRLDLAATASDEPPGVGRAVGSVHLVCTNGRHDPCCADFGRPVVRALLAAGVDAWESSHVGGDRFAANIVCLPTGVYFGRVGPDDAARVIADHEQGLVDLDCYRGRSCYPPFVQAAEILARHELGERRLDELTLRSWTRVGDERAEVVLALAGADTVIDVARRRGPAQLLTCGDGRNPPWEYRLHGIRAR